MPQDEPHCSFEGFLLRSDGNTRFTNRPVLLNKCPLLGPVAVAELTDARADCRAPSVGHKQTAHLAPQDWC